MSTSPTRSEPPSHPDADRAGPDVTAPQGLAGLLRRVFTYGKTLTGAVRLRSACPEFPRLAKPFGTTDLQHILARINSAMGRILLLEDWFLRQAGLGRAVVPPRVRNTRDPAPREPRQPRPARPDAVPDRDPAPARLAPREEASRVPTTAELAAELRGHPLGVMLAGICRDLGITPHHPLWDEVSRAIVACGGSIAGLAQDEDTRWCSKRWLEIPVARPPSIPIWLWPKWWPQPALQPVLACATGPP